MVEQTVNIRMSMDEFIERYTREPFELVGGRVIPLSPNVLGHQLTARLLFRLLDRYLEASMRGEVLSETPFVLSPLPDSRFVQLKLSLGHPHFYIICTRFPSSMSA